MNRKMKKAAAAICLGAMAFTATPAAFAAENPVNTQQEYEISPYMMYIDSWQTYLSIDNRVATVDCWVKGNYGDATKARVAVELQEKTSNGWKTIITWTDTQYDYEACVYKTKSVTAGKTYRVVSTVTVWEGSQSESMTTYGGERTA